MDILDKYLELQEEIYKYFGYKEDWVVIPIEDRRGYYWKLDGEGPGEVEYAISKDLLEDCWDDCYSDIIYTQRFLSKWIYRGKDYTMICVDTRTDGNKFLAIYSNDMEINNG